MGGYDGLGFFVAGFGLALNFGNKALIFWMIFGPVRPLHALFRHKISPQSQYSAFAADYPRKKLPNAATFGSFCHFFVS